MAKDEDEEMENYRPGRWLEEWLNKLTLLRHCAERQPRSDWLAPGYRVLSRIHGFTDSRNHETPPTNKRRRELRGAGAGKRQEQRRAGRGYIIICDGVGAGRDLLMDLTLARNRWIAS